MEKKKKEKRSVAPIYIVAGVWLLSLLYPTVHWIDFLIRGVLLSLIGYGIGRLIFKNRAVPAAEPKAEPEPEPKAEPKKSGSPEIDALMEEGDRAITEMRRLNKNIENETISARIDMLERITIKIFDHVILNPEKLPQIRKFLDYYLPTTLKILNAYDRMGAQGVSGENIDGTMGKIETLMETVVVAFQRQLDALFGAEALDIATEITVLENMMAREGLTDRPFQAEGGV